MYLMANHPHSNPESSQNVLHAKLKLKRPMKKQKKPVRLKKLRNSPAEQSG